MKIILQFILRDLLLSKEQRKLFPIIFFSFLINNTGFAQPIFEWAKSMGGPGATGAFDAANSIDVDANGNLYTTGKFSGTVDFDPGVGTFNLTSEGSSDIYISKLDALGNFIWAKGMGGLFADEGFSIAVTASGTVYTTGFFSNTVDFDPGTGIFNLTSTGGHDIYISKLDSLGNFVWAKSIGGGFSDNAYSIAIDSNENVYTTGSFFNDAFFGNPDFDPGVGIFNLPNAGSADIFVSKLDVSGNFVWAKSMGGTVRDEGKSIYTDISGNVYVTGYFAGTADFDPGVGISNLSTSSSFTDIFISKLDVSGNFVWAKSMGGISSNSQGNSIIVDNSGNVYTIGEYSGTNDFDPGTSTFNLASAGFKDVFVSKLDVLGDFVWAKSMGGTMDDYGNSITLDTSDNIYIMGDQYSTMADYAPGTNTFNMTNTGTEACFVGKYDSNGDLICSFILTPGHNETFADRQLVVVGSDVFITTTINDGSIDFDPCTPVVNVPTFSDNDLVVAKYSFANCNCNFVPPLLVNISISNTPCLGSSDGEAIVTPVDGVAPFTYAWYDSTTNGQLGTNDSIISNLAEGVYYVIVTDDNIQVDTQYFTITYNSAATVDIIEDTIIIDEGGIVLINTLYSSNGTISWSPVDFLNDAETRTPLVTPTESGWYFVNFNDTLGCFAIDSIFLQITSCVFSVPTAFTPNGDGNNDLWNLICFDEESEGILKVYNRWGGLVYESKGGTEYIPWDGSNDGKELPVGTYYYTIEGLSFESELSNGIVTIIK